VLISFLIICVSAHCIYAQGEQKIFNLSLAEVFKIALKNNLDIQMAKYDAYISETSLETVKSIFDIIIDANINYQNDQGKKMTSSSGTKTVDNNYDVGISKKFSSGTTIETDMSNNRNRTNASSAISTLNHNSSVSLSLTQELGKNFFGINDRNNIDITKINIENSGYTSLEKVEAIISAVKKVYWDLVLQMQKAEIQKDMVEQAKLLYEMHQEKLKDGLVEIPDAIASEANYKNRQNNLILEENTVKSKESILKLLLNITEDDITIRPTEGYNLNIVDQDFKESLIIAFDNRRDYLRAKNEIISKDISLVVEKNNNLPSINLAASLIRNGLGDHFKQSVTNISDENNTNYAIGLTFSLPLENREARAKLQKAEYEKAKALVELKLVERKITIEIIDQIRDCNIYKEFALNSINVAALQTRKLEEEEKRFNLGRSNTDTLIRYQEDVINAQQASASAQYQFHSSLVDLDHKKGILLGAYNLEGEK